MKGKKVMTRAPVQSGEKVGEERTEGEAKKRERRKEGRVCFPVVKHHWSLSSIHVYCLKIDRVTLNITCGATHTDMNTNTQTCCICF